MIEKLEDLTKSKLIENIIKYCEEQVKLKTKDNLSDEDFNNPSWALKQAQNMGCIKALNKLINYLPKQ